jgi:predicted permease
MAVRGALGAGFGRLARQLLTETLLLSAAGGLAGLLLARWMLDGLVALMPAEIPAFMDARLDLRVLLFSLAVAVGGALASGLVPVLRLRRQLPAGSLRDAGGAGVRRERRRAARALIVAEIAAAGVLLVGTALLVRSFDRLLLTPPGFDPLGVTTFQVSLDESGHPEGADQARFHVQAADALAALPGAQSAAGMSWQLLGIGSATSYHVGDRPAPPPDEEPVADVRIVTPRLFETLGIPLLEGRDFSPADAADRPRVVVVSASVARDFWPGRSALGQLIVMDWGEKLDAEIVGVVGDVRLRSLGEAPRAALYWPVTQLPNSFMTFFVRSPLPASTLAPALRQAVGRLDGRVPVADLKPLSEVVAASVDQPRFLFVLAVAFAATASLLAGVGLFGVIAEAVGQRRREMAVRRALGARGHELAALVFSEGLGLCLAGLALGLALARGLSRLLESQLYATTPGSPDAYAAAAVVTWPWPRWRWSCP